MPIFVLKNLESNRQKQLRINKDTILIGRSSRAEIPLSDTGVSKMHLIIRREASGYVFDDLDSQNGTFLNDTESSGGQLCHGDVLVVGRIAITFLLESADTASTPEATKRTAKPATATPQKVTRKTKPTAVKPNSVKPRRVTRSGKPATGATSNPGAARHHNVDDMGESLPSRPTPQNRKNVLVWSAIVVVGLGLGLGLGYHGTNLDESGSAGDDGSSVSKMLAVTPPVDHDPALIPDNSWMMAFPGLAPELLGHYRDEAESARVLLRLSIDLLGRPSTREEHRRLFPLPHSERWRELALMTSSLHGQHSTDLFRMFLNRRPTRRESEFLYSAPSGTVQDLGLWLTATEEYRSLEYRRGKSLRQMVTSLVVDFHDVVPQVDTRFKAIETAVLELPDLGYVVRALINSAPKEAIPAPLPVDDASLVAEIYRFRQNPIPGMTLKGLREVLEKDSQHLHLLRQTLALEEDYWGY